MPPGFRSSNGVGISETGVAVCGFAGRFDGSTTPPTPQTRPFLYRDGKMESLLTLNGDTEDGIATAVSELSIPNGSVYLYVVGSSGPAGATHGAVWASYPGDPIDLRPLDLNNFGEPLAIRAEAQTPAGRFGRIVGYRGTQVTGTTAFMWSLQDGGVVEGQIQALLGVTYEVTDATKWQLTRANSLSQDGYTVGGTGINPDGKAEGWIAVMPPHPASPKSRKAGESNFASGQGVLLSDESYDNKGDPNHLFRSRIAKRVLHRYERFDRWYLVK